MTRRARPKTSRLDRLEAEPRLGGDHAPPSEGGEVLEVGHAAVAEAGRPHGGGLHGAVLVVVDDHAQRGAVDLLGQDDQRLGPAHDHLDRAHELLHRRDRLRGHEHVRVVEDGLHPRPVVDQVRRHVAVLDVQALDERDGDAGDGRLLDADDAVLADARERIGHHPADALVLLGRDGGHMGEQAVVAGDRDGHAGELGDDALDGLLDAASQLHRVGALGEHAHAFAHERLGEEGRGRRAVAGEIGGLVGHLADELGAHVLELVGELDLARDRHAVVRDRGHAGQALQHHVAPLGPERDLDGVGQLVDAGLQELPGVVVEVELLAHLVRLPVGGGCFSPR